VDCKKDVHERHEKARNVIVGYFYHEGHEDHEEKIKTGLVWSRLPLMYAFRVVSCFLWTSSLISKKHNNLRALRVLRGYHL
jgi:hypothetical protein